MGIPVPGLAPFIVLEVHLSRTSGEEFQVPAVPELDIGLVTAGISNMNEGAATPVRHMVTCVIIVRPYNVWSWVWLIEEMMWGVRPRRHEFR